MFILYTLVKNHLTLINYIWISGIETELTEYMFNEYNFLDEIF